MNFSKETQIIRMVIKQNKLLFAVLHGLNKISWFGFRKQKVFLFALNSNEHFHLMNFLRGKTTNYCFACMQTALLIIIIHIIGCSHEEQRVCQLSQFQLSSILRIFGYCYRNKTEKVGQFFKFSFETFDQS